MDISILLELLRFANRPGANDNLQKHKMRKGI